MHDLERVLRTSPFTQDLSAEHVRFLVGCARNARYRAGEYLVRAGEREESLFLIRQGDVSVEAPGPAGAPVVVETLGPGELLGVSLLTPVTAHLDCRARETVLALALDSRCLLAKMEADPVFGYALSMRLLEHTYQRLAQARLQCLDVYR
jgi:CRP-like cAMP-binding protein